MKVLIVEDDPGISSLLRSGLDDAGYYTAVCRDGERALRLAATGGFGLMLLDVMLPTLDGLALCRRLRESGSSMPILMVTARDGLDDRIAGFEAGADDYLVKPFDYRELLARVRALLRREHSIKQGCIEIDDLVVNTSERTVSRGGIPISLTGREYTLLEALACRTGQILTREVIMEQVWSDPDSVSNTVDVYIKNLRRKIDSGEGSKLIHTVHGIGYTLRTGNVGA